MQNACTAMSMACSRLGLCLNYGLRIWKQTNKIKNK